MSTAKKLTSALMSLSIDHSPTVCYFCESIFTDIKRENCHPTDCTLKALTRLCDELDKNLEEDEDKYQTLDQCDDIVDSLYQHRKKTRSQKTGGFMLAEVTLTRACGAICND